MKNFLTLFVFTLISVISFGQNFAPFNENVPKRFLNQNDANDNSYFFYPTDMTLAGSTFYYKQYFKPGNGVVTQMGNCGFWGGTAMGADTTWLGASITYDSIALQLSLTNDQSELLQFDFDLNIGDSSVFYSNATDTYYIRYDALQSESIHGEADDIKTFTIRHFDNSNQLVNSMLNDFEIKLGENLGLVQFINTYRFPAVETRLELRGQLHPTIGNYQMTYEEAYPWDAGDIFEYSYYRTPSMGLPISSGYFIYEITNRIETTDNVTIYFTSTGQINSTSPITFYGPNYFGLTSPFTYAKKDNVVEVPHNMVAFDRFYRSESIVDNCGLREQFQEAGDFLEYCTGCNCTGPYDGFGQFKETHKYQAGLGQVSQSYSGYGAPTEIESGSQSLFYFKLGGVECGNIVYLNLEEQNLDVTISPNPANDEITIELLKQSVSISLIDCTGKKLKTFVSNELNTVLDIQDIQPGVYYLLVDFTDSQQVEKVIVQ